MSLTEYENPQPGELGDPPLFGPPFVRFVVDEFERQRKLLAKLGDRLLPRDRAWRAVKTGELDANGTGTILRYEVPQGFELFLHRVYVNAGTATFSSRVTGGNVSILVDGQEEDGGDLTTVGLPFVETWSSSAAIVVDGGGVLEVKINTAGAAAHSTAAVVIARGRLIRSHVGADEH